MYVYSLIHTWAKIAYASNVCIKIYSMCIYIYMQYRYDDREGE